MTCQEIRPGLMESARASSALAPALAEHVARCPDCAALFESQAALTRALHAFSEIQAPGAIGNRVFAEVDRPRLLRQASLAWRIGAVAALAAALTIGVVLTPRHTPPKSTDEPFIEIPYTAPLAPYERAEVRHMNIPVAALIAAGLQTPSLDAGATVPADVLLGQDGRIHAIRLNRN